MRSNKEIEDQIAALVLELFHNDHARFVERLLSLKGTDPKAVKKALEEKNRESVDAVVGVNHYIHWSRERQSLAKRVRLYHVKHRLDPDGETYDPNADKEEY